VAACGAHGRATEIRAVLEILDFVNQAGTSFHLALLDKTMEGNVRLGFVIFRQFRVKEGETMVVKNPRVAVVGARGMLARMVMNMAPPSWKLVGLSHPGFDLTDQFSTANGLAELRPDVIINCAAYTDVDGAESKTNLAFLVNGVGPGNLARAAKELNATLVHISSDYVFNGNKTVPYGESDPPDPRSVYGKSKLQGEQAILESGLERFFILRTSWLYGAGGKNFVETIIRLAQQKEELHIVADQIGSPTYTADLAQAVFTLLALEANRQETKRPRESLSGIYHFSNEGACSWHRFASEIVSLLKKTSIPVKTKRILPIGTVDYPLPAPRPCYSVLSGEKYKKVTGAVIPGWREALERYVLNRDKLSQG
jgi:dTDP-4-dehydrorhamnose reductase